MTTTELLLPGASYDNKIYQKYAKGSLEKKLLNKESFCQEFGVPFEKRHVLLGIITELSDKHGADLLEAILPGIKSLGFTLAIRARGSAKYQSLLEGYDGSALFLPDDEDHVRKILSASDATLFFRSGEENERLIQSALSYAALPVVPKSARHLVEDYNPNQESGNGFLYEEGNMWSAYEALVRVKENFKFPYDYKTIQQSAME